MTIRKFVLSCIKSLLISQMRRGADGTKNKNRLCSMTCGLTWYLLDLFVLGAQKGKSSKKFLEKYLVTTQNCLIIDFTLILGFKNTKLA